MHRWWSPQTFGAACSVSLYGRLQARGMELPKHSEGCAFLLSRVLTPSLYSIVEKELRDTIKEGGKQWIR